MDHYSLSDPGERAESRYDDENIGDDASCKHRVGLDGTMLDDVDTLVNKPSYAGDCAARVDSSDMLQDGRDSQLQP